ncbi:hypothetical protein OBBRIDRAFT_758768 [Obba rivulosa]|uniref:Protein kinase domain-containing protein n=1 Tax=Obba rivulosa TaxID=1052685 RepID=A0A8E2DIE0_9APHY|nr:hypothetical protein OBBRIDRAFT_758768 [Obba rivulosa]
MSRITAENTVQESGGEYGKGHTDDLALSSHNAEAAAHGEAANANIGSKYTETDLEGGLSSSECWWRDRQQWLEEKGYMLRPRYRPDWVPSWLRAKKDWLDVEDGRGLQYGNLNDATRLSDGKIVVLKKVSKSVHPYEAEIGQYFSTEPLASDPRNHCVPIHETLQDPTDADIVVLVMPLLREHHYPPANTIGEVVELFKQIFEGLNFMHEHHVAHRDCMVLNIMMDPTGMFPKLFHPQYPPMNLSTTGPPKQYTRTERPTKYYFIDFGLSRKYDADNRSPRELPILGGDKSAPEFQGEGYDKASDPFPTDVYYLGNMIKEWYLQKYLGLEFMEALVVEMTHSEPSERPTMIEVVTHFDKLYSGLAFRTLRRRLVDRRESSLTRLVLDVKHTFVSFGYMLRRLPPIPIPRT